MLEENDSEYRKKTKDKNDKYKQKIIDYKQKNSEQEN